MADPLGRFVGAVPAGVWWSAMTISADESSALIASLRETSEWANEQPAGDDFWPLMGKLLGCAADEILSLLDRLAALEALPEPTLTPTLTEALPVVYLHTWGNRRHIMEPDTEIASGLAIALCGERGYTAEERVRRGAGGRRRQHTILNRPLCSRCEKLAAAADGGATPEPDDEASDEADDGPICGLCGVRRPEPGHTACGRCA